MAPQRKESSIEPRAPPRLFSSVTRAPGAVGSTATRKTAGEESRAASRGRNNTPRVSPRSAARCRRRICRGRALRSHASAMSQAPDRSVCSKAHPTPFGISLLQPLWSIDHEHALQRHAVLRKRRRERLQGRRHPCAPTRLRAPRHGGESRQQEGQLPCPKTGREDLDQPSVRPAAPRQTLIESRKSGRQRLGSRGAAASPDGGMLEKSGEIPGHGMTGALLHQPGHYYINPWVFPRRNTPTTMPSMSSGCSLRSTLIGSKSLFSGSSQTTEPS